MESPGPRKWRGLRLEDFGGLLKHAESMEITQRVVGNFFGDHGGSPIPWLTF